MIALAKLRQRLLDDGVAHPDLAATVLVARGRCLFDQSAFADLVGVPVSHVRSWESGARPPIHVPRRIAALAPDLDWPAAGVTAAGDPSDPASRHPSAGGR